MNNVYRKAFSALKYENIICPNVYFFESIGSTNDYLNDLAANGAAEGTVVVSYCQTNGHGRSGRSFYSPEGGNLYMSILLRPDDLNNLNLLTPAAAVAVYRAVRNVLGIETGIKWVNDLYYNNKKVCGILASAYGFLENNPYVVVGIGINVSVDESKVPEDIRDIYGSLIKGELSSEEIGNILPKLASSLYEEYMNIYKNEDVSVYMSEYRKRSIVVGKKVSYLSGNETVTVDVVDIDDKGGLVVREANGCIKTYMDGEIRIKL